VVKWLVQFVLPLALAALALVAVVLVGYALRPPKPNAGPPRTRLADVEVETPPGLTREAFLEQVQAAAALPDALALDDPTQVERLRNAFKAHPWVRLVAELEQRDGRLRLPLDFRRPVLLISSWGHPVDGEGVLLPRISDSSALLVDASKRPVPTGRLGQRCPEVRDLAQLADRLPLRTEFRGASLARDGAFATLQGGSFRLRWPIGQEAQLASLPGLTGFTWELSEKDAPVRKPFKP
jgi:hypothetical protein